MKRKAFLIALTLALALSAALCIPAFAENGHQVVTVSGGDVVSVDGDVDHYRIGYEDYRGDEYSFWGFSDEDDYDYGYDYGSGYDYGYGYGQYGAENDIAAEQTGELSAAVDTYVSDADAVQAYNGGYVDDSYGYAGVNDVYADYGFGSTDEPIRTGFNGLGIMIALGVGAIIAFTFYSSTKHAYENAGIGVVYDLRDNASLELTDKVDRQAGTRKNVERGYYGRSSGSAQGGSNNLAAPAGARPPVTINMVPRPQQQMPHTAQVGQRPPQKPPQSAAQSAQQKPQMNQRPQQNGQRPANVPPPRPPRH